MTESPTRPESPLVPLHMRRDRLDPAPELACFRERGEVPYVENEAFELDAFVVTRYEEVREVFGDAERFGNSADFSARRGDTAHMAEGEHARLRVGQLLAQDPPEHTRLRRMLTKEFGQARIRRLAPRITEIVDAQLDAMAAAGPPSDLMTEFAIPIPSLVICELLGVPYADRDEFQARSHRILDTTLEPHEHVKIQRETRGYMSELVERARREPRDDLLGMLVSEHGDEMTRHELANLGALLLTAGHDTTSSMLGLSLVALLDHPEQLALIRDDPAAVRPAVEELLRYLSIVHSGMPRVALTDTEVAGVAIPEGAIVLCSLSTANRDPRHIEDPDRFDVRRGSPRHLAFGHGIHHCLGAPLARMEMETALPALLRRFPGLAHAGRPDEVPFRGHHVNYAPWALPVTW
jgi:cytochrome P450